MGKKRFCANTTEAAPPFALSFLFERWAPRTSTPRIRSRCSPVTSHSTDSVLRILHAQPTPSILRRSILRAEEWEYHFAREEKETAAETENATLPLLAAKQTPSGVPRLPRCNRGLLRADQQAGYQGRREHHSHRKWPTGFSPALVLQWGACLLYTSDAADE